MRIAGKQNWIARLPAHVRDVVHARMSTRSYAPGDTIVHAGSPAQCIHQVQSGYVKILKNQPNGDQVLLALYIPGNVFSESPLIAGRDHNHTTIAATPVTLKILDKQDFDDLFEAYPEIPQLLCQKLAGSTSFILQNRELSTLHNVATRVALLFCNLAKHCAIDVNNQRIIEVPLSVSDCADFLGMTRQTVQKEVSRLKTDGILQKTDNRWIVLDLDKLKHHANINAIPH